MRGAISVRTRVALLQRVVLRLSRREIEDDPAGGLEKPHEFPGIDEPCRADPLDLRTVRVSVEYGRVFLRAGEAARELGAMREGDLAVFGLDETDLPVKLHVRKFLRGDVVDRVAVPLVVAENDMDGPFELGEPIDDERGDEVPAVEERRDA